MSAAWATAKRVFVRTKLRFESIGKIRKLATFQRDWAAIEFYNQTSDKMDFFWNKAVLITGAGTGIGKALALHLAARGAKVVLNGRRAEKLREVKKQLREQGGESVIAPGDVAVYADCARIVQDAIAAFGRLDILVNNAGMVMEGELEHTAPEVFKILMETNYLGSVYMTKAALPWLKSAKGSVFYVSTVAAKYGMARHSGYSASKMALTALAQALRVELNGTGVHLGVVYVGFVENEPDKTQFNVHGQLEAMPDRQAAWRVSVADAAAHIAKAIAKRWKSYNYSFLGRLLSTVHAISPALTRSILTRAYNRLHPKG
jgi:NAD(P)-dependent dehydrogenase (short-subunit alcohol dehydrogenase family)